MSQNRIYIRFLEESDAGDLLYIRQRNRAFFQMFEPIRLDSHYTFQEQIKQIQQAIVDRENDKSYSYGIFLRETNQLIGRITLSGVVRGPFQNANVGYFLDKHQNGKGYATEAVRLIVKASFEELILHRIQAAVMPRNVASKRILEKSGFKKEGYAPRYLHINGVWEDHEIFAITKEEYE